MSEAADKMVAVEKLKAVAYTYEWWGTEEQQHRERMKACRDRRQVYPDDDCERDGSCSECHQDMAEALETKASKARRRDALAALRSLPEQDRRHEG